MAAMEVGAHPCLRLRPNALRTVTVFSGRTAATPSGSEQEVGRLDRHELLPLSVPA